MTLKRRSTPLFVLTLALELAVVLGTPAAAQTFSVLHYFTGGADGSNPEAGITVADSGLLYGTAAIRGTYGYGTVFKLSRVNSTWFFNPLFEFTGGSDGSIPIGGVVIGPNGALYGTTQRGGDAGDGIVFALRPPATFCNSTVCYWNETLLHTFTGVPDGLNPWTENLAFDTAGNIYGTTGNGGMYDGGTAFKLTPSGGGYTESILHNFGSSGTDGAFPFAGVVLDTAGNVYGNTTAGGTQECQFGCGTVYQLMPSNGSWLENILVNFDLANGNYPNSNLIIDASGNLYGTTVGSELFEDGLVFKLAPSGEGFTCSKLLTFRTSCSPYGGVTMDAAGNLFGVCLSGGSGNGWVFELTNCSQSCVVRDLYNFNGRDGSSPYGSPTLDANGNLYGTTEYGGNNFPCNPGCGVVWEIAGVGAPSKN
jgi:uncharacterized repeat protein (TIGR03803 family)